jgi:hypothetical protein
VKIVTVPHYCDPYVGDNSFMMRSIGWESCSGEYYIYYFNSPTLFICPGVNLFNNTGRDFLKLNDKLDYLTYQANWKHFGFAFIPIHLKTCNFLCLHKYMLEVCASDKKRDKDV